MAANEYHFITNWLIPNSTCQEISDVLGDADGLAHWWPSVYLDVKVVEPGASNGVGKLVKLYTKGFLPYTLKWAFRVTDNREPAGFSLEAVGDFKGVGVWTFTQKGNDVEVIYDWRIMAEKGMLKTLSFIMKPLFSWNHHWAMKKGLESLKLELQRIHANTAEERKQIPSPPKATWPHKNRNNKVL
jgi:hypothetical protein